MGNGAWCFRLNDVIGLGSFARVFAFRNQRAVTTFSNSNEQRSSLPSAAVIRRVAKKMEGRKANSGSPTQRVSCRSKTWFLER